jgi:glycosyltransferase involved in cell wall biosynthesis
MRCAGNDYSQIERYFSWRTGQDLCGMSQDDSLSIGLAEALSVVICCYNGRHTLLAVLVALEQQRYRNFEVLLVDDGSDRPIEPLVRQAGLTVPVTLIRSHRNLGLATARNLGIMCAGGDSLVFLDDDMLAPDTMTGSLALRQTHAGGCVFVGFREDVAAEVFFAPQGRKARIERDWRYHSCRGTGEYLFLAADQNAPRIHRQEFSLVNDSVRFKELGHCRVIEFWDLPGMVAGHSICLKRDDAVAAGGFSERYFHGWGAEDMAFGAVLTARGHYVVPALDWTSLHLRQGGRHCGRDGERETLRENFQRYLTFIREPVDQQRLPAHRLRSVGREPGLDRYEVRE